MSSATALAHTSLLSLAGLLAAGLASPAAGQPVADTAVVVVHDRAAHPLAPTVFGHFLERASWGGELGVEAGVDPATGALRPGVRRLLETMPIPILRFPGGTDIDHIEWTDLITGAPGRASPERPMSTGHTGTRVTNRFGYDEALALAEDLGSEVIFVLPFGDCYLGTKPVAEAARHAAGIIAYANAEVGADLPEGMPDWPSVRAQNGRAEPWDVSYVQIANEPFVLDRAIQMRGPVPDSAATRFFECVEATVDVIRAIDPDIDIIVDGNVEAFMGEMRSRLGDRIQHVAYHAYKPWAVGHAELGGERVALRQLTPTAIWYAWVATPSMDSLGLAVFEDDTFRRAAASGYPVAVTEWNWNGWWTGDSDGVAQPKMAQGLGAAGFLHALMRAGDVVQIANQSMLVGQSWGITGIRVDSAGRTPPHLLPTGQVTGFYARHAGDTLLATTAARVPAYAQPYRLNSLMDQPRVAYVDALATQRADTLVVHAINRHYDQPLALRLDLSDWGEVDPSAVHHVLTGSPYNEPCEPGAPTIGCVTRRAVTLEGAAPVVVLPPRSVSAIEIVKL